ncbi:MAG TPA: hypothetical protein VK188_09100 [Holophaga sp.]|nr:hypothetical protein [Holophaga sp.]
MIPNLLCLVLALAPPAPVPRQPAPAAEAPLDRLALGGLRLGMGEAELKERFPALALTPKGGLRVGKVALPADPLLKEATELRADLSLVEGRLARMIVAFTPPSRDLAEAGLLEGLGPAAFEETHTYKRGQTAFLRRELTWFGREGYASYRSFNRPGDRQATLMVSLLPRQENRAAYDTLQVNRKAGSDVYLTQGGAFVKAVQEGGKTVFNLRRGPFQIGVGHPGLKVALATHPIGEYRLDLDPASTDRFSCLGAMYCGAVDEAMDVLFVCDGRLGCDSLSCLSPEFWKTAKPLPGHRTAYAIGALHLVDGDRRVPLAEFQGRLYGFISVTLEATREDGSHLSRTMPIELVFR